MRIVDVDGRPIAGFDFAEGAVLKGDSVRHAVRFAGKLASLQNHPVRLEFRLQDAELYGFELL